MGGGGTSETSNMGGGVPLRLLIWGGGTSETSNMGGGTSETSTMGGGGYL